MKLSMPIRFNGDPAQTAQRARDLESAGIDLLWAGEVYGFDSATLFGFLAGQTERVEFMSGIFPIYSRTPTLIAQTAATLDALSRGRFNLGLGTSGPQVIEGWHGVPFDRPVGRTKEVVEICRMVWKREPVAYEGKGYSFPLPEGQGTGLGKALKFMDRPLREDIPVWVASLGPKNVEMTAEVADGWQPLFFVPDKFRDVWGDSLDAGGAKRSGDLDTLKIIAGGTVAIGSEDQVREHREAGRATTSFYVGGMGARGKNFYNDLFGRYGWEAEAKEIQDLFLDGHRKEAAAKVPDEYLRLSSMCGDEGFVRERIEVYKQVGVTHLEVNPVGEDPLAVIEQIKAWAE